MNNETRNTVIAVILAIVIMAVWQFMFIKPKREAYLAYQQQQQELRETQPELFIEEDKKVESLDDLPSRVEMIVSNKNPRVKIQTDTLHGSINLKGARFDDLTMAGYNVSLEEGSPEVALFSPVGSSETYFAEFGWRGLGDDINVPTKDTVWSASSEVLVPNQPLILSWNNGQNMVFEREVQIDERYMITVTDRVINKSEKEVTLWPYGLVNRSRSDKQAFYISHEGAIGSFDNILEELTFGDMEDGETSKHEKVKGWLGLSDQYWMSTMIPDTRFAFNMEAKSYQDKIGLTRYQVNFVSDPQKVAAGEELQVTHRMYAGAKKGEWINQYAEELNLHLFDRTIDYGALYFITKPIYYLLIFFNGFFGHFGLAILAITVCIKALLFPLANKSYKSMGKMKLIMPEMQELKEKYGNDRMKMNEEMMKLYKEKRVNPASGCLPILIQIPIFFALYKMIYITLEMRHQPFYGWIEDMSAPDPTNMLNLFGLLPYTPPSWLPAIGILPLLFGLTMFLQQKLNPPPTDPTQKMILNWLPFIFVILFSGFAAGLVIYWVWSNILSILQQWVITRKLNAELTSQTRAPKAKKDKE